MANTPSAKKRIRQNEKARLRNKAHKTRLRNQLRKFSRAIATGNGEQAKAEFTRAQTLLDKGAQYGIIHRNHAARRKSRMSQKLDELLQKKSG